MTVAVVTAVAFAAGMRIGGSGIDLAGLYVLAALTNVIGLLWAAGVVTRVRTMQAGPLMQTPVFLALFLAPAYVPLALLKGWIHGVASVNPVTHLLEAGRGLIAGSPTGVALAFGVAGVSILAFAVWTLFGLRRAEAAG